MTTGKPLARLRARRSGGSTLGFPLRMDATGRVVTIPQLTPRHAAEIVGHVLCCQPGERGLAPGYGLTDPSGQQAVSGDLVASTVVACEPDVAASVVMTSNAGALRLYRNATGASIVGFARISNANYFYIPSTAGFVAPTVPWGANWAASDGIEGTITYEAA